MRMLSALSSVLLVLSVAGCPSKTPKTTEQNQQQSETTAVTETAPAESASEPATETAKTNTPVAQALPKLWDFWATWCPPCREQKPIVEELAKDYADVIEIKSIDVDENKDLAKQFNVSAIPTLVFLDATGKELSRRVGLYPKDSIIERFKSLGFIK